MKKIISGILTAAMLLGMLTIGVVAKSTDYALKFDDTLAEEGGGRHGYAHYVGEGLESALDGLGMAVSFDFVMGRRGPCIHPVDPNLYHSSKLNLTIGNLDGMNYYVGYNADKDVFYLAESGYGPLDGEGPGGLDYFYLVTSETGLVNYGVSYNIVFMFDFETGFKAFLDGELIMEFDLYEDKKAPSIWSYEKIFFFSTHITYYMDNLAIYRYGGYDFETGELIGDPVSFCDFNDLEYVDRDVVDDTGAVVGSETVLSHKDWNFILGGEYYHQRVVVADEIYGQPNYDAGDLPNLIFANDVDSSSDRDFTVDLTMANNTGIDKIELELLSDPYITPVSVEAADGYTASLNGNKLTITGSKCKNEAVATITYHMSVDAIQDFWYGYGAKVGSQTGAGGENMADFVITNGQTEVYNYTVGDVNGDGNYNLLDVTLILKFNAKWDLPNVFKEAMEVNGDGRVNNMDASYYMRHLAGWEGYEYLPKPKS